MRVSVRLVVVAIGVIVAALLVGRHRIDDLERLEAWIASLGAWGPVLFVGATIVLTSLFVPDTPLAILAGLSFGLWWGTLWVSLAGVLAAVVDFWLARRWLRRRMEPFVAAHPRLNALQRVADHEGLRFHFLLRMTPLSPTLVSYVLGTTRVRPGTYTLACLGHVPGWFAEVYVGHAAGHATRFAGGLPAHPGSDHVATFVGLAVSLLAVTVVAHRALRAVQAAEASTRDG